MDVMIRYVQQNQSLSLDPQTKLIPEADIYRLVMRSKLSSAVRFEESVLRTWVTEEVLPSIHATAGKTERPSFRAAHEDNDVQSLTTTSDTTCTMTSVEIASFLRRN